MINFRSNISKKMCGSALLALLSLSGAAFAGDYYDYDPVIVIDPFPSAMEDDYDYYDYDYSRPGPGLSIFFTP